MKNFEDNKHSQDISSVDADHIGSQTQQNNKSLIAQDLVSGGASQTNPLIGLTLLRRFVITKKFNSSGAFGEFYSAQDLQNDNNEVLVKVSQHLEMNSKEHDVLQKLNQASTDDFPKLYSGGEFVIKLSPDSNLMTLQQSNNDTQEVESKRHSFIIIERLGKTLQHYLYERNQAFSLKTVCQIGIRLIELLKRIHDIGIIYNDLKLDNILIGDHESSPDSLHQIRLIDFGLTTPYIDDNLVHIKQKQASFSGNLAFCSKNAMNYTTLSRRDDLISLTYMLLYLHQGRLDFLESDNQKDQFQQIAQAKNYLSPETLCGQKSHMFLPFVDEIHNLQFTEQPNYHKLQFMLLKCLLDNDHVICQKYDWSVPIIKSNNETKVDNNNQSNERAQGQYNESQDFNLVDEFKPNYQGIKSDKYTFMINNNFKTMKMDKLEPQIPMFNNDIHQAKVIRPKPQKNI